MRLRQSATAARRARHPGARVVLVTVDDDAELAERGYAAGAIAFVLKHGERYVSPDARRGR